jgi:endonuclease-8
VPEGDTVWLTAQRLHTALGGEVLTVAELRVPSLATTDLRGVGVHEVVARGKHLLIRLEPDLTLHSHLRMDGSWHISRRGQRPGPYPAHHIRVSLGNDTLVATGYRIHDLALVRRTDEGQLVGHLGPDLLGADWDADEAVRRLQADGTVAIADALLEQRNLAGIGNLYKSEVLFLRGIDPWRAVDTIADLHGVVHTAHKALLANRDHPEQSTTGSLVRGEQHWVYRRSGEACRRCRTPIRIAMQGDAGRDRATYWCPTCQR